MSVFFFFFFLYLGKNSILSKLAGKRIWKINLSSDRNEEVKKLLALEDGEDITYTFFKSNYILINFQYINQKKTVSQDELALIKACIKGESV